MVDSIIQWAMSRPPEVFIMSVFIIYLMYENYQCDSTVNDLYETSLKLLEMFTPQVTIVEQLSNRMDDIEDSSLQKELKSQMHTLEKSLEDLHKSVIELNKGIKRNET